MKLTEPGWIIMNALWDEHPAKARDVVERLPSSVGWAYTTVKTMLGPPAREEGGQEDQERQAKERGSRRQTSHMYVI